MNKDPFTDKPPTDRYLARAAWIGSLDATRTWLKQGVININAPAGGRPPLLWAISRGHRDVMEMLLKAGADIAQKTEDGDNALACAVWSGNTRMVQLMMERGFDPLEKNIDGKTAADWAEQGGNAEIMQLLKNAMIDASHARVRRKQQELYELARRRKQFRLRV